MAANGQGLLQGWNSLLVRPEPLLIKDIKAEVNKQKLKIECPAQMKHNSDKMTIAPMSSQPCSKPNVSGCVGEICTQLIQAQPILKVQKANNYFLILVFLRQFL